MPSGSAAPTASGHSTGRPPASSPSTAAAKTAPGTEPSQASESCKREFCLDPNALAGPGIRRLAHGTLAFQDLQADGRLVVWSALDTDAGRHVGVFVANAETGTLTEVGGNETDFQVTGFLVHDPLAVMVREDLGPGGRFHLRVYNSTTGKAADVATVARAPRLLGFDGTWILFDVPVTPGTNETYSLAAWNIKDGRQADALAGQHGILVDFTRLFDGVAIGLRANGTQPPVLLGTDLATGTTAEFGPLRHEIDWWTVTRDGVIVLGADHRVWLEQDPAADLGRPGWKAVGMAVGPGHVVVAYQGAGADKGTAWLDDIDPDTHDTTTMLSDADVEQFAVLNRAVVYTASLPTDGRYDLFSERWDGVA